MPDPTPLLERFDAVPGSLALIRTTVQAAAEARGCNPKCVADIVMAVNEACMNIIQHAYKGDASGVIELEMYSTSTELEVVLKDFAPPVDVDDIRPRRLEDVRPGGLGTFFIRQSMDDCTYGNLHDTCGNYLRMKKKIG